jgi:hypothetical protein
VTRALIGVWVVYGGDMLLTGTGGMTVSIFLATIALFTGGSTSTLLVGDTILRSFVVYKTLDSDDLY